MEHPQDPSVAAFLKRLMLRSDLTAGEQRAILRLDGQKQRYRSRADIVRPGEIVQATCLVVQGVVARFDQMLDGRRQLTSFYIAGDMCDLHSVVAPKASWSITAISDVTVLRVPHTQLRDLCLAYPAIALAFWRDGTADASIFSKWVGNLGRKNAAARIAHLVCEMAVRIEAAGLGKRKAFDLPVVQEHIAEATGITVVHANRTLQELRARALLRIGGGRVEIPDWNALAHAAEFDPDYLLLEGPPHRVAPRQEQARPAPVG